MFVLQSNVFSNLNSLMIMYPGVIFTTDHYFLRLVSFGLPLINGLKIDVTIVIYLRNSTVVCLLDKLSLINKSDVCEVVFIATKFFPMVFNEI